MAHKNSPPAVFSYTTLPDPPSDDYIPFPPQIEESRKAEFRILFIEHTRLIDLKTQMTRHSMVYSKSVKAKASRDAEAVYRSFRVLPYDEGEGGLFQELPKDWLRDRLKKISDQIMEFSEDVVWREKIQGGKRGQFVLNNEE